MWQKKQNFQLGFEPKHLKRDELKMKLDQNQIDQTNRGRDMGKTQKETNL